MPLTPTKRRDRSGSSDFATLTDLKYSAFLRCRALLDDRLRGLFFGCHPPDGHLPSSEVLQVLTLPSFMEGEMEDALVEKYVADYLFAFGFWGPPPGLEESKSADVAADVEVYSADHHIPYEEFVKDANKLISRRTPVDECSKLDREEVKEHELKRALYRIKACLLLHGQQEVVELGDAAFESKYPRKLIEENSYFLNLRKHQAFGWYFDPKLCQLASLTDYQRLVIFNYGGDQYEDWSRYKSHYNTPETDREYLLYWKTITEKIKWVEDYMHLETFSTEWSNIETKARYQAIKIATKFENIHYDLALLGIEEFLWSTRLDVYNLKDLDSVFFEIWKRIIREKNRKDCFTKALKEVYELKMFPSRERSMKYEETMEEQFQRCTVGLRPALPEPKARELIAQQVRRKLAMMRGYEHYARKKLKIAEYIGLIGKAST